MSDIANSLVALVDSAAANEATGAEKIAALTAENTQLKQQVADAQANSGATDEQLQAMIDKLSPPNDALAAAVSAAS